MYGIGTDIDAEYLTFCQRRLDNLLNPVIIEPKQPKANNILDSLLESD
jgi:hypothetical protein